MNLPILSICIPTFNRAQELSECVGSIINQLAQIPAGQVEIVISDNASDDATEQAGRELAQKFPYIRYFRNAENIGFDRNVLGIVEKARGLYCWLLGDDDALFPEALSYILPILSTGKYGYLLANAWGYDRQMHNPAVSYPNLRITEDLHFEQLANFVKGIQNYTDLVGYFGGMSCQIFKRSEWIDLPGKEDYIGTQTVHLFVLLKAYKNLPALIISDPMVKTRADNMRWSTFPGLETVKRRAFSTRDTQIWISKLYGRPYSELALTFKCYGGIVYGSIYGLAKRTILKNQAVRNFIKRALGK